MIEKDTVAKLLMRQISRIIDGGVTAMQELFYCASLIILQKASQSILGAADAAVQLVSKRMRLLFPKANKEEVEMLGLWPVLLSELCRIEEVHREQIRRHCRAPTRSILFDSKTHFLREMEQLWERGMGLEMLDDRQFLQGLLFKM